MTTYAYIYTDDGPARRVVPDGYTAQTGELVSTPDIATQAQLEAAFPAYAAQLQFDAAIAAGIQITSTGTPALDGTYALDEDARSTITSEQVYIATTGKFTNGETSRAWLDASGTPHLFPSTAEFTAFAEAVAQYYDALNTALVTGQQGGGWVAPSQPSALP